MAVWIAKPYGVDGGAIQRSRWYRQGMNPRINETKHVLAVKAIQAGLLDQGFDLPGSTRDRKVDGWFGAGTDRALRDLQGRRRNPVTGARLTVDGLFGPATARALFMPLIDEIGKRYGVPQGILCGKVRLESAYDPGARNSNDREDSYGLTQINLMAHTRVSVEQALDPRYNLDWAGRNLRDAHQRFSRASCKPGASAWELAIANHNSPRMARDWCETGEPTDWIADYVAKVLLGC